MNDLELFESKYPKLLQYLCESIYDVPNNGWKNFKVEWSGEILELSFSSDYTGGLEGWYVNKVSVEVTTSQESDDYVELCCINILDRFCDEGDLEVTLYEDAKHLFTSDIPSDKVNTAHNEQNNLINQGDLNMAITTRAPKTVTIIDNNKFVDDNDSVIFEVSGIFSGEDKDILLQIMAENDIPTFLAQYNESRVQVVDQEKQIQSGIAGFKLPPLKIRDLTSSEVSILIK